MCRTRKIHELDNRNKRMLRSKGGAEMMPAYYEKIFAANRNMHKLGGENKAVADFLKTYSYFDAH